VELTTSVVIGTDCTGICESNYHAITQQIRIVRHDITEILLKVALNAKPEPFFFFFFRAFFEQIWTMQKNMGKSMGR
jgi:hypothetical protein